MKRKAELLEKLAQEVCTYNSCFEDICNVYEDLKELLEYTIWDKIDVARAIFFGDIKNWQDDLFYVGDDGNLYSCSFSEHEKNILEQEKDIINEFLDIYYYNNTECLETEHLEILSELKALGVEVPEGLDV